MLTLLTTDEFADWFAALDDQRAEEVATGLELIRELGSERAPPNSRDMLLWYQTFPEVSPRFDLYGDGFMDFAQRLHQIVAHLESEAVQQRLGHASLEMQQRASLALTQIRGLARSVRVYPSQPSGNLTRVGEELQAHYQTFLRAAGVPARPKPPTTNALRELNFPEHRPQLRVLYGVDAARECALLVSGEALDRRAFGPSVRHALKVWQQFLEHEAQVRQLQPRSRP